MITDLTYNQVMNLVYFTSIICTEKVENTDPDYILEKWSTYIGINPLRINQWDGDSIYFTASQEVGDYCRKWGVDENVFENMKYILMYLYSVKHMGNIETMVKQFNIYIGNSVINDNNVGTRGIHPKLLSFIERWCSDRPSNVEYLQIIQREQDINDILNEKGEN